MPSTSRLALPYPAATDPPNGPAQIQALADALDPIVAKTTLATIPASESTSAAGPVNLTTPGPSITVTVPSANLLVEVFASVAITPSATGIAKVFLIIDGVNQGQVLAAPAAASAAGYVTVPGSNVGTAAAWWQGGFLVAVLLAGSHTIALQYGSAAGSATFSGRSLALRV
jgi:hypothetical protein